MVEERADRATGHYAPVVRRIADGFAAAGCDVTVLTSLGLCEAAAGETPRDWAVRRYGPMGRNLERLIRRPDRLPFRHPLRRPLRRVTVRLRSLLILIETSLAARRLGEPSQVVVVLSGRGLTPLHAALLAPTRGRWLCYRHERANTSSSSGARSAGPGRLIPRIVQARVRSRDRHGGRFALAGPFPDLVETWRLRLPAVTMGTIPLAIAPGRPGVDHDEARRQLGLPSGPLALYFGGLHPGKAPETVWAAWSAPTPPAASLVAAGRGVRASLDAWSDSHPGADTSAIHVVDGAIHDDTKQLLFAASDLGVLSFADKPIGASATLGDFITHRRPVCCSSGGDAAEVVGRYGLGVVFQAEDPVALVEAVAAVRAHPPAPGGFDAALEDYAEPHVAREMLRLVDPSVP